METIMYDLDDLNERVREYIAARHPTLHLDEPCSLKVINEPSGRGGGWMFIIQYRNPAMSRKHLLAEFTRYTVDIPQGNMEARDGCGGDYITVRSGPPLLIGDGDDSLAVYAAGDGLVSIWLRAI
jgi:hypothetical protein